MDCWLLHWNCTGAALKLPVEYKELLAVITAALKVIRHCQLNKKKNILTSLNQTPGLLLWSCSETSSGIYPNLKHQLELLTLNNCFDLWLSMILVAHLFSLSLSILPWVILFGRGRDLRCWLCGLFLLAVDCWFKRLTMEMSCFGLASWFLVCYCCFVCSPLLRFFLIKAWQSTAQIIKEQHFLTINHVTSHHLPFSR